VLARIFLAKEFDDVVVFASITRGASPLGLPDTLTRGGPAPLRSRASLAVLARIFLAKEFDDVVVFASLSQHEQRATDGVRRRQARTLVGRAHIVDVDAAAFEQTHRFAL
jgi:hypothetical protein